MCDMASDPASDWQGVTPVPKFALLIGLSLLLTAAVASRAEELPADLAIRLRNLASMGSANVGTECSSLLERIDKTEVLTPQRQASGLDRLRDTCAQRLSWTNPLLARIAERAVARRRVLQSKDPAALCQALRTLGLSYHYLTRVKEAHQLYQEALAVSQRWRGRGTTDEDIAAAQESLSSLLVDLGTPEALKEAMEAAEKSLHLRRGAVPFRPEKVVTALTTRARVEEKIDLRAAKATLLEALPLSRALGPEHNFETSRVASNLGDILHRLGELPQAIILLQEAERLRLRDHRTGRPTRQLAATQLLLGQVYYEIGDYPQAIDYHRKAVVGHREWLGEDPYRYCDAITGLAAVLEESGRWEEARSLQRQALAIREKALRLAPSNFPNVELRLTLARSLTGLGALQQRMGDLEAGRSLERALAVEDEALVDLANVERARTLLELAEHWRQAGNQQRARQLIDRCLEELGKLGEKGPLFVDATEAAARVAENPAIGLRRIEEASRQAQRLYGQNGPRTANVLQVRAELKRRQGNRKEAVLDALSAQRISLPHVRSIVQAFPRDQALVFAADRRQSLDLSLQLAAEMSGLSSEIIGQIWQTAANSRMLVRDAEIDRQRLMRAASDPQLSPYANRVSSARERFAYLLVQTRGTIDTRASRLDEARRNLLEAEAALAGKARRLLPKASGTEVSIEEIRRHLPAGAALVAVYRYRYPGGNDAYLAFVANGSSPAQIVVLGEAVTIDWLVHQWRDAVLGSGTPAESRLRAGEALRRKIWDPIVPLLGNTRTVFVVPDGALHLVPLIALPASKGKYLIEQGWMFHRLTAERDLLALTDSQHIGSWLAVGGVDYNRAVVKTAMVETRLRAALRSGEANAMSRDPLRSEECQRAGLPSFDALPGSREELQDLVRLWNRLQVGFAKPQPVLNTFVGQYATEQALRRAVRGQRVVHLATHGFAFAGLCDRPRGSIRGIGGLSLDREPITTELQPFSGLVLAGANDRKSASRADQDGILTEEEILDLDLEAADWVVLSACDSGLGKIRPGEGVVGMLRAFQVAGAKTVIVSLWSVDDQAARIWMRELYRARFERRLTTIEAVQQAALYSLSFYRKKGDDNPAKWAGFLANGNWK